MKILIFKKLKNIKFSNIIHKNNSYFIYGIDSLHVSKNISKFIIFYEVYDNNFDFVKKVNINYDFKLSTLIWDIIENNIQYIFLIEQKSVNKNKHQSKFYKYYINKENIEDFKVNKIEKIELENFLIFKIYKDKIISSKIEIDEERPDYYWGKYLFNFMDENKNFYKPEFDNIVNYSKDKGHLIHFIENNNNTYLVIFSIRHKYKNDQKKYYYKIYSAYSDNLKKFYNTKEVKITNKLTSSEWYCYPEVFKKDNKYYVLLNQDDFGKEKESLLGELIIK